MLFDNSLLSVLGVCANNLCKKHGIESPNDYQSLNSFFDKLSESISNNEIEGNIIGLVLYHFISSSDVRDRKTTGKTFEEIFEKMLNFTVRDTEKIKVSDPPDIIKSFDSLCFGQDWKFSEDLAKNKQKKGDHQIKDYILSVKTLKGELCDISGKIDCTTDDNKPNTEINIGSLSYRALFSKITRNPISDRKGGLGSKKQMLTILNEIKEDGYLNDFKRRLFVSLRYLYTDDFLIVYKSGFLMEVYLIPARSFRKAIALSFTDDSIDDFVSIWARWEGHDPRLQMPRLLSLIDDNKLNYNYYKLELYKIFNNIDFLDVIFDIYENISTRLNTIITDVY